jgi:3-(methylthio)propanoyl-CoA dehydrogenase
MATDMFRWYWHVSEDGTSDGRGLSMFIYDRNHKAVIVRRLENKMGIKGSPTCELVFKDAPAELVGSRKMGLIKYVMALMNGARLGIAAQSVGISEAAYREALVYAKERKQFGKSIIQFPAVYEMLANMKAKLDASRTFCTKHRAMSTSTKLMTIYRTNVSSSPKRRRR